MKKYLIATAISGPPGVGKTTYIKKLLKKSKWEYISEFLIDDEEEMSKVMNDTYNKKSLDYDFQEKLNREAIVIHELLSPKWFKKGYYIDRSIFDAFVFADLYAKYYKIEMPTIEKYKNRIINILAEFDFYWVEIIEVSWKRCWSQIQKRGRVEEQKNKKYFHYLWKNFNNLIIKYCNEFGIIYSIKRRK